MKGKAVLLSALLAASMFASKANAAIILNEVFLGDDDYIEIANTGTSSVDLLGFSVDFFEGSSDLFSFASSLIIGAGEIVVLGEQGSDQVFTGFNIPFNDGTAFSVSLSNASGTLLDYMSSIANENLAPGASFVGGPLSDIVDDSAFSFQRLADTHSGTTFYAADWAVGAPSKGTGLVVSSTPVSEPSVLALLGLGFLCLRLGRKSK